MKRFLSSLALLLASAVALAAQSLPTIQAISPSNALPGATVTISGTNLSGLTAVSFGGVAATSYSYSATSLAITATVPTGARTGLVTVTTSGGTSSGVLYTIPLTITTQPFHTVVTAGTPQFFSVTAVGGAAGGTYSYAWQRASGGTPVAVGTNSSQLYVASPGAADVGEYTVVVSDGTSSVTSNPAALRLANAGVWTWRNPTTTGSDLWSVAYGAGRYVAVGRAGTIVTSADGQTWSQTAQLVPNLLTYVTYLDSKFIAIGSAGILLTSADGLTWSKGNVGTASTLYGIARGASTWVVAGTGGVIFTSPDLVVWTRVPSSEFSSSITATLDKVITTSSGFMIVSLSGHVLKGDATGANWTVTQPAPGVVFYSLREKTVGGVTTTIAAGGNSKIYYSTNGGTSWTAASMPAALTDTVDWESLLPTDNGWIVVGGNNSTTYRGYQMQSTDGITWTLNTALPNGPQLYDVIVVGGQYVAVGIVGRISRSTDAVTWTQVGTSYTFAGDHYAGTTGAAGTLVAGRVDQVLLSTNHETGWAKVNLAQDTAAVPTTTRILGATQAAGTYVVVGGNDSTSAGKGFVFSSTLASGAAASTWTRVEIAGPAALNTVVYDPVSARYVAAGDGTQIYQAKNPAVLGGTDGWTAIAKPGSSTATVRAAAVLAGRFVLTADNGVVFTSSDALNWTLVNTGVSASLEAVAAGGVGTFVAGGSDARSVLMRSTDNGATWTRILVPFTGTIRGMTYADGLFRAVGGSSTMLMSADGGLTWTAETSQYANIFRAIVRTPKGYVAAGTNGVVATMTQPTVTLAVATLTAQAGTAITSVAPVTVTSGVGVPPYSFSVSPTLPAGLQFNQTTGEISGTPSAGAASTSYTVVVTDLAGVSASSTFTLSVNALPAAPTVTGISPSNALPGATVTISGTNLSGPTAVSFGGLAASTFSYDATSLAITATVPTGARSGPVTVTTAGGTSNGFANTIPLTITAQPTHFVGAPEQAMAFSVTAQGGAAGAPYTYAWTRTNSGGTVTLGGTASTLYLPAVGTSDEGDYAVTVSDGTSSVTSQAAALRISGADWTWRNPLPTGNDLWWVAFGGGKWLSVGTAGTFVSSQDNAASWSVIAQEPPNAFTRVVYAAGKFVAVGTNGNVLSSTDLTSGTNGNVGQAEELLGLAERSGLWVATGAAGSIYSSTDLVTWTRQTTSVKDSINAVTATADGFLGLSTGGAYLKGVVGTGEVITWTTGASGVSIPATGRAAFLDVKTLANGGFVAAGSDGLYTSANGTAWTKATMPTTQTGIDWQGVTVGAGSTLVAVGNRTSDFTGYLATSSDGGATWTSRTIPAGPMLLGVAYANNVYVAVGTLGHVITSTDAVNWIKAVPGGPTAFGDFLALATGPSGTVAAGRVGSTYLSADHETGWTNVGITASGETVAQSSHRILSGTYAGGKYVLVGGNENSTTPIAFVFSSSTAASGSWTKAEVSGLGALNAVTAMTVNSAVRYLAAGAGGNVYYSGDPAGAWTAAAKPASSVIRAAASGNGQFVLTGDNGVILRSSDGVTWTAPTTPVPGVSLVAVATNGSGVWIAGGYDGRSVILRSSDNGATWTRINLPYTGSIRGITYYEGRFRTVGGTVTSLVSSDGGLSWGAQSSGYAGLFRAITRTSKGLVAVGSWGGIATLSQPALTLAAASVSAQSGVALTPVVPVTSAGGVPPYVFSVFPALPAGLQFDAASGQISGTPVSSAFIPPFAGSDDFAVNSSAKWPASYRTLGSGTGNGTLTFNTTAGRLDFSKADGEGSQFLRWDGDPQTAGYTRTTASYSTSWQAEVTATNGATVTGGEYASTGLQVASDGGWVALFVSRTATGVYARAESSSITSGSSPTVTIASGSAVRLRFTWDATSRTLKGLYSTDAGANYTELVSLGSTSWVGTSSRGFFHEVFANSSTAGALAAGVNYLDDFKVVATTPNSAVHTVYATDSVGLSSNASFKLTVNQSAVPITSASTASAVANTDFNYQITANNSPTSFSATGLPAGLTLNAATGLISGKPTTAGTYTVSLTVTNALGTSSSFPLTIAVNTTVAIVDQLTSRSVVAGNKVLLRVGASTNLTGATLAYQWKKNGTNISGATTADLVLAVTSATDAAAYSVAVSDGTNSVTSASAQLTVLAADPVLWNSFTEYSTEQAPARTVHDGAGRVYVSWSVYSRNPDIVGGRQMGALVRLNESDGSLDPTFRLDARIAGAMHLVVEPSGKLLVAVRGPDSATVVRVTATGEIDTATPFNAPSFASSIRFIARQSDGKVLVVATDNLFSTAPADAIATTPSVVRLNADGSVDASFSAVAITNGIVFGPPVIDSSGRIYLAGAFTQLNGVARPGVARLTSTGALDSAFPSGLPAGFTFNQIRAVALQSGDRPVFVGDFYATGVGSSSDRAMALRFTAAGAYDTTFTPPLRSQLGITNSRLRYLVIDANDRITAVSDRLVRLSADGTKDNSFSSRAMGKEGFWLSTDASNRLFVADEITVAGGASTQPLWGNGIAVFSASGSPDFSFQTGGWGRSAVASSGVVLSDGRVWVGGGFNRFGSANVPGVALFGSETALAATQLAASRTMTYGIVADAGSDRVFAVSGTLDTSSESGSFSLVRLSSAAAVDSTFNPALPSGYAVYSADISASPGGKVVLSQPSIDPYDLLNGATGNSLLRLNADGSLDSSFTAALGAYGSIERGAGNAITMLKTGGVRVGQVLADGRILLAASAIDGTVRIVRHFDSGATDTTFTTPSLGSIAGSSGYTGTLKDPVTGTTAQFPITTYSASQLTGALHQTSDGKVYVGGRISLSGAPRGLVRLNTDGSLDSTFVGSGIAHSKSSVSPYVAAITSDSSGRIYVAGQFDSFNGNVVPTGIFRLKPDGTFDAAWSSPVSVADTLRAQVRLVAVGAKLYLIGSVSRATDALPAPYRVIDITPAPVITSSPFGSATVGTAFSYQVTASNSPTSFAAAGLPAGLSINSASGLISGTPTVPGTTNIALTATNVGGTSAVVALALAVNAAPAIATQPQAQTVNAGTAVTMSVVATGTPAPTYQWRKGEAAINGATGATFSLAAAQTTDSGSYDVVVTNSTGSVTSSAATLTVNLITQTLTFNPSATKTYGDGPFPVSATSDSGLSVTVSLVSGPATISAGTVTLTGAGTVVLRASQAGDATRAAANVERSIAVAVRPLTVTAVPKSKAFGAADPALTYTITSGSLAGADVLSGALARATGETVAGSPYAITQGTLAAGANYALTYVGANLTIMKATPTVTVTPGSYIYNATAQGPVLNDVSRGGSPGQVTLTYQGANGTTYVASTTAPTNAGSYTVTAVVAADANFESATSAATAFTIAPRPLTVTAAAKSKVYGAADPALTYSVTSGSFVGSDALSGALARAPGETVAGGPYAMTQGTVTAGTNYALTYVGANLTITKAIPVITWNTPAAVTSGTVLSGTQLNATAVPAGGTFAYTPALGSTVTTVGTVSLGVTYTPADTANYNNATAQQTLTVTVPVPVITSAGSVGGSVGSALTYQTTATNSPTSYAATGLAQWMSFNQTSGVLSGTPTTTGTTTVSLTALNAGGSSVPVTLTVNVSAQGQVLTFNPPATKNYGDAAFAVSATSDSGLPVTISVASGPATISSGTVTLTGAGTVVLRATQAGDAQRAAATLDKSIFVNKGTPVVSWSQPVSVPAGTVLSATQLNATANLSGGTFTYVPAAGTTLGSAGTTTLAVQYTPADTSNYNSATAQQTITVTVPVPVISSAGSATTTVGSAFSYQIVASNTPTSYAATGLPAGLSLNAATGIISGTPTTIGSANASLTATNAGGSSAPFTLAFTVQAGPAITTQPSANAFYAVGNTPTLSVVASGTPAPTYQWRKGGVNLSGKTGTTLSFAALTVEDAGTYDVVVTNTAGSVTSLPVTFAVYVPPTITTQPVAQTVVAGGSATFSVVAAGDPVPALQWRRNGLNISGATAATLTLSNVTFDQAGTYSVYVANAGGNVTSNGVALTVNPVAPVITSPLAVSGVRGLPLSYQATATSTGVTFSSSVLPAGLTLNASSGQISGTPTALGTTSVTITATNVTGTDTKTVSFVINPPPPVISSALAFGGRVSTGFSFQVTASNTPTSYAATGLPAGLSIIAGTGLISGSPTVAGVFDVVLTATNAGGSATSSLQLTIEPPLNAPTFSGSTNLSAVQGSSFTFTPAFSGAPFTANFTAVGLPAGVTLSSPSLGTISGTPTVTGTFTVTITATNNGGSKSVDFTLVVNSAPSAPVITSASTLVATVGSPVTFQLTSQGNPAASSYQATGLPAKGLDLNSSTGLISGVPNQPGTLTLAVSATSSSVGTGQSSALVITINPSPNAPVISSAPLATGRVGVAFSYQLQASNNPSGFLQTSGTLPAGLAFDSVSGAITGTPTEAGDKRVWFAGDSITYGRGFAMEVLFSIAPPATAPVISSNGTAAGQVGLPFQYQITATNSPTGFAATGLPEGLSVDTATGVISGLPLKAGTFSVTLTAMKGTETSDPKTLSLTIQPAPATPVITSPLTAIGRVGTSLTYTTTASESPTSFVATGLPAGLSLSSATGVISGTPTVSGTFTVTLRAANGAGLGASANLVFTLSAALNAPSITSAGSVTGKVGADVGVSYQAQATPGPISGYAITGKFPLGLTFNTSTGLLSGNPAEAGVFNVQLTATNDGGVGNPQTLVINISPSDNVPVITSPTTVYGMVGTSFTYQISASSSPAFPSAPFPAPFLLDAVNLPPGLAVNPSTGVIQGTPTTSGTYTASLVGTNTAGTGQPRSLTVVIDPAPTAPVVNSPDVASAQAGVNFSYQITATEKPTGFEVLGAPVWMAFNSTTGAISGVPSSPGTVKVDLVAKNVSGASKPATLTLSIAAAANAPVVTSPRTASGTVQAPFTYQITALVPTDAPPVTSYFVSGLPTGLSFSALTGVISGTPLASGTFWVTLVAKNTAGESLPVTLTLTIAPNITFNF